MQIELTFQSLPLALGSITILFGHLKQIRTSQIINVSLLVYQFWDTSLGSIFPGTTRDRKPRQIHVCNLAGILLMRCWYPGTISGGFEAAFNVTGDVLLKLREKGRADDVSLAGDDGESGGGRKARM